MADIEVTEKRITILRDGVYQIQVLRVTSCRHGVIREEIPDGAVPPSRCGECMLEAACGLE